MNDENKKFWVVWNPKIGLPKKRHCEFEDAHNEAVRLSNQHKTQVYVMAAIGVCEPQYPPIVFRELS